LLAIVGFLLVPNLAEASGNTVTTNLNIVRNGAGNITSMVPSGTYTLSPGFTNPVVTIEVGYYDINGNKVSWNPAQVQTATLGNNGLNLTWSVTGWTSFNTGYTYWYRTTLSATNALGNPQTLTISTGDFSN
jgi:hypothetical protein